ncbi:MAG: hypothetical protein QM831_11040 [Kofleriaceae bacterium]
MTGSDVVTIRPFLPAKNFAVSKEFYLALGFTQQFGDAEIAGFELGGHAFLLQNFYVAEWAGNFVMHMTVKDVDAWWAWFLGLKLVEKHPDMMARPPEMQPWGLRVAYISDPSGVLWHIAQQR